MSVHNYNVCPNERPKASVGAHPMKLCTNRRIRYIVDWGR